MALVFLSGFLLSCNDATIIVPQDGNPDGAMPVPALAGLNTITLSPQSVTLTVTGQPTTQAFTAVGQFDDGHSETLTDKLDWSVSPASLGRFPQAGSLSVGPYGGDGVVVATSGSLTGQAQVSVRVSRQINEPDAPGVTDGNFGGKPDAANPAVMYPYDGVVMPPNLGSLDIQWVKGNPADTIFEITLQNKVTDIRVFTACRPPAGGAPNGCSYPLGQDVWSLCAYSNLGNTDPVLVTVRSTNTGTKTVGTSKPIGVKFAADELKGGIYYWTTVGGVNGISGIYRIDLQNRKVEPFYTEQSAPNDHRGGNAQNGGCVGCHAITHDGNRLSLVLGGAHISDLVQLDVATRKPTLTKIDTAAGHSNTQRQFSNFQSYNPDGTAFVSALAGKLRVLLSQDGSALVPLIATGGNATHPDWSHSGSLLAFTRYSDPVPTPLDGDDYEIYERHGAIGLVAWNGKNGFNAPKTIVAEKAGQNSYYPTVAPNDRLVVFNRVSACVTQDDCMAYANPKAQLYATTPDGIGETALTNVNRRGPNDTKDGLSNSWPKFSPFFHSTKDGRVQMWVTFSSIRNYGVQLPHNSDDPSTGVPQLWMAAVTVGGEPMGGDPSSPPFWIPNQNLATHNHIAQWTEEIVPLIQ